jgi:periplasmic divalent cation tolerance protein
MTEFVIISTTSDDRATAEEVARSVVEKRLAACASIIATDSVYRWNGELCSASEWLVSIKTTREAVSAIEAEIKQLHSYELPEILVTAVIGGSDDYLAWIRDEVDVEPEAEAA